MVWRNGRKETFPCRSGGYTGVGVPQKRATPEPAPRGGQVGFSGEGAYDGGPVSAVLAEGQASPRTLI